MSIVLMTRSITLTPMVGFRFVNLWGLARGVGEGFKVYAPKKALEITQAVAIGAVMTVGMTYLMPVLPAAVPTLVAAMGWVSTTASALTFAYSIATDLQFIIKNFNRVFCSKDPPQSLIKSYGIR